MITKEDMNLVDRRNSGSWLLAVAANSKAEYHVEGLNVSYVFVPCKANGVDQLLKTWSDLFLKIIVHFLMICQMNKYNRFFTLRFISILRGVCGRGNCDCGSPTTLVCIPVRGADWLRSKISHNNICCPGPSGALLTSSTQNPSYSSIL
jgi:hypothetical protein